MLLSVEHSVFITESLFVGILQDVEAVQQAKVSCFHLENLPTESDVLRMLKGELIRSSA